ncbi:TGF-beta-activated kinase 1 and MAP3K7-binding protein 1 [Frankliniella fusca]|uniref:TGF-beta-activated kinase 1 and MAP3K7-binding protein 1 n=1 Tax=Frankliniella fusca TaxID=407009 RepID=A0AAE1HWE3_9NEOP|nr:TGF-beta-activated kinase 1 and MAP3K7-binding protein 1 [Frankliniella fusca]
MKCEYNSVGMNFRIVFERKHTNNIWHLAVKWSVGEYVPAIDMSYVLVFWDEPSSSSIVHKSTIIGGSNVGAKRLVMWARKQLWAKIVRTGTKKDLEQIVLTADGQVYDPRTGPQGEVARSRRQVVDERLRRASIHRTAAEAVRSHFLCNLTGDELAVEDRPPPPPLFTDIAHDTTVSEMVKALPLPLFKDNLRLLVNNLPCLRQPPEGTTNYVELAERSGVYVEGRKLRGLLKAYGSSPHQLFREIFLHCVPPVVLALPHISAGGRQQTVSIPKQIKAAISVCIAERTDGVADNTTKRVSNLIRDALQNEQVRSQLSRLLVRDGGAPPGAQAAPQAPVPPPGQAVQPLAAPQAAPPLEAPQAPLLPPGAPQVQAAPNNFYFNDFHNQWYATNGPEATQVLLS